MVQLCLVTVLIAGFVSGCGGQHGGEQRIVVGGKDFTEQYILAEFARILLEQEGFDVELRTGVSSPIIRKSLVNDQVDLYYEYTGTAYTVFHEQNDPDIMRDQQNVFDWVKEKDAENGLIWLQPVQFNNTYTLIMRKAHADELGIRTLSDLAAHVNGNAEDLVFAVGAEFWERPDGFKKLADSYNFDVGRDNVTKMDIGLTYKALKDEQVDVAMGFNTDGRIVAFDFVSLEDDKHFFPAYNPAPVVRQEVLDRHPQIRDALKPLADVLTTEAMRSLNATVDIEHKNEREVAYSWLTAHGLIKETASDSGN